MRWQLCPAYDQCRVDGTLYIVTNKASLIHEVEMVKAEPPQVVVQPVQVQEDHLVVPQLV